ncbi:MAG: tetratricopeptide repeat protein [Acidobacteriota bacterium]
MNGLHSYYDLIKARSFTVPDERKEIPVKVRRLILILVVSVITVGALGCSAAVPVPNAVDACSLTLAPHSGDGPIDRQIIRFQEAARTAGNQSRALEQLGWSYVQKARVSYDTGFYKLAEQCAVCLESRHPDSAEALLIRGHVLDSLHRFSEAEAIARRLAETRGAPFDYGLLGDALMEQGRLNEAVDAYQKMIDLKPGPYSYSRVAHVRWLKGDLEGAIEMMRKAAAAMSPRDAESAAWAYTRLALYELQAGSAKNAERACEVALHLQNDYAPALLARSRVLLAENRNAEAVRLMQLAARINPLPEYRWLLGEALRAAGRDDEARAVEDGLKQSGAAEDPRTFALFLATRREQTDTALMLVEREMKARGDVFTLDALAWALAAAGRLSEAREPMRRALAEGTKDARLFYHAGSIAAMDGQKQKARLMLNKAAAMKQMLLPSEREGLSRTLAEL